MITTRICKEFKFYVFLVTEPEGSFIILLTITAAMWLLFKVIHQTRKWLVHNFI